MRVKILLLFCLCSFLTTTYLQAQLLQGQKIKKVGVSKCSCYNFSKGNLFPEFKTIRIACTLQDAIDHADSVDVLWFNECKGAITSQQVQFLHKLKNVIFVHLPENKTGRPCFPLIDSLCLLPGLQHVDWNGNAPRNIGSFQSLQEISSSIDSAGLQQVCKMKALRSLKIYTYGHESPGNVIPDEIGNLSNLIELEINGPGINFLPSSLVKLQNLKKLTLSNCQLTTLPDFICRLENLEELTLYSVYDTVGGKEVFHLPDQLGGLVHLKKFSLLGDVDSLPESFSQLQMLESVSIHPDRDVTSKAFPLPLARLKSHPYKVEIGFLIDSIPEAIATFGSVDSLETYGVFELDRCWNLKRLPNGICHLNMELKMHHLSREFVDISALNGLTTAFRLDLGGEHLRYRRLVRSLDDGHDLTLIIHGNKLPGCFRKLKKLQIIEIDLRYEQTLSKHQKRKIKRFRKSHPQTIVVVK